MAHGESLRLREIRPNPPRVHVDQVIVRDRLTGEPLGVEQVARSAPPSARRPYRGKTRKSMRELGAKGIPPWRARANFR